MKTWVIVVLILVFVFVIVPLIYYVVTIRNVSKITQPNQEVLEMRLANN